MTFRKGVGIIHLWLGLTSGLVVFIIAITGCIYAFQEEIQDLTQPYRFTIAQDTAFLPPSRLREIADAQLPGKHIHGVLYQGHERAAQAIYFMDEEYYDLVYLNPYTGEVLQIRDEYHSFFRFILDGHFYLWLPHQTGQLVVATATLVFVAMIITGLIMWWPRSRGARKMRFRIKANVRWRRRNYDLHNVLGFYAFFVALVLGLTGLVWGFEWFRDASYATTGGSKSLEYTEPLSDTTAQVSVLNAPVQDILWERVQRQYPNAASIEVHFPEHEAAAILMAVNAQHGTYWQTDYIYYDQFTLQELPVDHIWGRMTEADAADKLMRMNYDIHTGAVLGLSGKILVFFASLIVASLPFTGFMIWYGRRRKVRSKATST